MSVDLEELDEREGAVAARRDEEVLPVRRLQDGVETLPPRAWIQRDARAVRIDSVHRQTRAVEIVARRREDDEVQAGCRLVALPVDLRPGAPEKGIVQGVEVRPL